VFRTGPCAGLSKIIPRTRVSIHLSCVSRLMSPTPTCSVVCASCSTASSTSFATTRTSPVRRIPDELETVRFIVPNFATMFARNSLLLLRIPGLGYGGKDNLFRLCFSLIHQPLMGFFLLYHVEHSVQGRQRFHCQNLTPDC